MHRYVKAKRIFIDLFVHRFVAKINAMCMMWSCGSGKFHDQMHTFIHKASLEPQVRPVVLIMLYVEWCNILVTNDMIHYRKCAHRASSRPPRLWSGADDATLCCRRASCRSLSPENAIYLAGTGRAGPYLYGSNAVSCGSV